MSHFNKEESTIESKRAFFFLMRNSNHKNWVTNQMRARIKLSIYSDKCEKNASNGT